MSLVGGRSENADWRREGRRDQEVPDAGFGGGEMRRTIFLREPVVRSKRGRREAWSCGHEMDEDGRDSWV